MGDQANDQEYIRRFIECYPPVDDPPPLEDYASPHRYDALYMGDDLEKALSSVSNDGGGLAWGLSNRMRSLNDMYRSTDDSKYLEADLQCIREVLRVRDDRIGKKLWTGKVVPAWGSDKYADRGRAVFAVHTGIVAAAILEFLILVRSDEDLDLGGETEDILRDVEEALKVHDPQWRDGPGDGEGHYIGMDQERVCDGKPLPGNRLSAMGWAIWLSWTATGDETHRNRAIALGRYMKGRLTPSPDGAYYWPYWLPVERVTREGSRESIRGEDTSHAGLTLQLPLTLGFEGEVFRREDLERFARTVTRGFGRLGGGILFSSITGQSDLNPLHYIGAASRWLALAEVDPGVGEPIIQYYQRYKPLPNPWELSQLILYAHRA